MCRSGTTTPSYTKNGPPELMFKPTPSKAGPPKARPPKAKEKCRSGNKKTEPTDTMPPELPPKLAIPNTVPSKPRVAATYAGIPEAKDANAMPQDAQPLVAGPPEFVSPKANFSKLSDKLYFAMFGTT